MATSLRRAAFLVTPHAGGIFTVFLNLRAALLPLGIQLEWIGCSHDPAALVSDQRFAPYMEWGHLIDARPLDLCARGEAIVRKILDHSMNLVFTNVLMSVEEMSVPANLPPGILRVSIVHNITPGTYAAAKAVAPFVHASVGVSPRIHDDLVQKLGVPQERAFCAPNALDLAPYEMMQRPARIGPLRMLSLGRIVDIDKGVLWLPHILEQLKDIDCTLTVAGDGPDLEKLKQRCAPFGNRVTFFGRVAPSDVPEVMAAHDLLLMPSRFEGFGYTLIEAMAAGCVPIATRLRGVTDYVIQDGVTGSLFPMGNTTAAAQAVRKLSADAPLLERYSLAGREDVRNRFSISALSRAYAPLLASLEARPHTPQSRYGRRFELLRPGGAWRRFVPSGVKNFLRKYAMR